MAVFGIPVTHTSLLVVALLMVGLTIWAIVSTANDKNIPTGNRVVWIVVLVIFPLLGLASWVVSRLTRRFSSNQQ